MGRGKRGPLPPPAPQDPDLRPAPPSPLLLAGESRLGAEFGLPLPWGPNSTHPCLAGPLWLQLALVSKRPTRFGFDCGIAPNRKILLEAQGEELMLPSRPGKEIEENAENVATRAVAHSPPLLHQSYSSFPPAFGFTLREKGGNHLLRSSSPL